MIDIIITSFNEPNSTLRAVNAFLQQDSSKSFRVTVVDPHPEVGDFLKENISDKRFQFFLDSGEGKSYALNLLFQEYGSTNKRDIFILSDGDVFVSPNTIESIVRSFDDDSVGCVTGKPVSIDSKSTKYGYWSHLFFEGIDRVRRKLSYENKFFECSGYLFAIRKGVIFDFPLETSEDSIIPYLFWKKGYRIKYIPEAEVYVKNPSNWHDWITQKIRNVKAHENLNKLASDLPRTKSLTNEIRWGALFSLSYPTNLQQLIWTFEAYGARLYLYLRAFKDLKNKRYADGWRGEAQTKSTSMFD